MLFSLPDVVDGMLVVLATEVVVGAEVDVVNVVEALVLTLVVGPVAFKAIYYTCRKPIFSCL
jgi:hypothetical protein